MKDLLPILAFAVPLTSQWNDAMNNRPKKCSRWILSVFFLSLIAAGCASQTSDLVTPSIPTNSAGTVFVETALPTPPGEPIATQPISPQPTDETSSSEPALYEDDFTNRSSGWQQGVEYDNYVIGYHEPDYYHIEIRSPNDDTSAFIPGRNFTDGTFELKVFTNLDSTAETGDFSYGLAFRRSGDQFYAFTVSPRTQKWYFFKSSPNRVEVLKEGTDGSIKGLSLETEDALRIDAMGSTFFLHINGRLLAKVSDPDYAEGEVGLYVQSIDSTLTHIHFNSLTIREVQPLQPSTNILFQDDFTDPSSGWQQGVEYNNYVIGYHEPDYYHIEVRSPNDKTSVFVPDTVISDATLELKVFTNLDSTAESGDFSYGLVFRRTGDEFYAFTISPRSQKWSVLKSFPNRLDVLDDGTEDSIQGFSMETEDTIRVDLKGSTFFFHINDKSVFQMSDSDYTSGEVGLYVQTFDSDLTHIHFDNLVIREVQIPWQCIFRNSALYLREGPSSETPPIAFLFDGTRMEPVELSADQKWIRVRVENSEQLGWVAAAWVSCNVPIAEFPTFEQ